MSAVVLAASLSTAHAGRFGGFNADRTRYLNGNDQVCTPLDASPDANKAAKVDANAAPSCARADAGDIAAATFRKGERQSGDKAYRADSKGTKIRLFAPGAETPLVSWDAGGVVSRISGVYATDDASLVAVEFESRRFGRAETDVIAFRVGESKPAPKLLVAPKGDADAAGALRDRADAAAGKRKWKQAEALYRKALAADPADAAARYGLAVALARRNKHNEALRELQTLSRAKREVAIPFLVDARTNKAFKKLENKPKFRRAVGLDRGADAPLTAYERLLDGKAIWEVPHVKCESAGVELRLRRKPATFKLKIIDECEGMTDTLRLDGTWTAEGESSLTLTFPNPGADDDVTTCSVQTCEDGSGEDCLTCKIADDLAFTLRPDRR